MVTIYSPEMCPLCSLLNSDMFQVQGDKEKLLYELDNLQRELEKAQVNTTRFQHEKEDFEVDAGRQREKNEKLQVRN